MAIGDDFSIAVNGDIRHTSGTTRYTVLDFHRWLQDLADNASSSGDDFLDITDDTPSDRSTDNIITLLGSYNIDDTAAEYLYDGSISQDCGDTLYAGLIVVGAVYGTTTLQVVQDNALYDGDSPFWGTGINTDPAANILCRMMIKVRDAGSDIDGKRVRVYAREWGATYAEFSVTMGLGNATAAIFTNQDLNNQTDVDTVATWTGITNVEGYQLIDINNGNGDRPYFSQWNRAAYSINQLYERAKWLSRRGSSSTVYGMDGELFRGITHEWDYDVESGGPFSENETLSWGSGTTAGTGALLALDDNGSTGTMWIQLLTGVAPTDGLTITGGLSSATCSVNGSPSSHTLGAVFLGTSTGSAIIGAFGVGIEASDLSVNDKIFDLTNTQQSPPNTVTFTLSGLVSGEDQVLVGPKGAGNEIDEDQLSLTASLTSSSVTSVTVTPAIPTDTPTSGTLRIKTNTGVFLRVPYSSWTGSTFTIPSYDFSGSNNCSSGNDTYISYIDKTASSGNETFSVVYSTDRNLYVRVRDGGATPIKTFETPAVLGSAGGSSTAIRTSDE